MYTLLNERVIFKISGADSAKFLQGLLSNDVTKITSSNAIYACMLTPQGKYFADFFLIKKDQDILFDIINKLNMYKLRSSINISKSTYQVVSFVNEMDLLPFTNSIIFDDPRSSCMGKRAFIHEDDLQALTHDFTQEPNLYDNIRIDNFIPEGDKDLIPDKSFISEYGLDNLNAIDYNKGCYVGQELTARTHYLGKVRKQIMQVISASNLPSLGIEIYAGEQKLGIICSSVGKRGLALIRIENLNSVASGAIITADNVELKLILQGDLSK